MAQRVKGARKAYKEKKTGEAQKYHTKEAIQKDFAEEHHTQGANYLKDMVYGGLDGIITTFAIVAGVMGASLSFVIILILGFANLIGDGVSMAVGNYLGTKSERDYYNTEKRREYWEVKHFPKGEEEEIRQIYHKKGFRGNDLEMIVKTIIADKHLWVDEMMKYELGLMEEAKSPAKAGLATFASFVAAGFIPLLSYVLAISFTGLQPFSFPVAIILTAITIFGVGSARALVIDKKWYIAGLEMLLVGGLAAVAAFVIGFFLSSVVTV